MAKDIEKHLHEQMMAEIQQLLRNGVTHSALTDDKSPRFREINDLLGNHEGLLPLAVLEARTSSERGVYHKQARLGYGLVRTPAALSVVNERIVIPINPHISWRNILHKPYDFELVHSPFQAILRGDQLLDEEPAKTFNLAHNLPVSRSIKRLTVAVGDDAKTFINELTCVTGLATEALFFYNDQLSI